MKKVLAAFAILLVLFAVAPAMAPATKTTLTAELVSAETIFPGVTWTSADVMHVDGIIGKLTLAGDISGTMTIVEYEIMNMKTGVGASHGTFVLTIVQGTFAGSFRGMLTLPTLSGSFVGQETAVHGGRKIMGTYEGVITSTGMEVTFEGTILSPKA